MSISEALKTVTAAENPYANFATAVHPFVHQFCYDDTVSF